MPKRRRLPALRPERIIRALQGCGFSVKRTTGSHYFLTRPGLDHTVTIARHSPDLPPGTIRQILQSAEVSEGEFLKHV